MPSARPEEISALPGVSLVMGNSHKHEVADYALPLTTTAGFVPLTQIGPVRDATVIVGDIFAHTELMAAPVFEANTPHENTRPNLKIQDGCNNRCSFCVIPYVRGRSRSLKLDHVIREVDALVACSYREMVLSGINLGRWGRELLRVIELRRAAARDSRAHRDREDSHQLGRADGLDERADRAGRLIAAHRQARARAAAVRQRPHPAQDASQVSPLALR